LTACRPGSLHISCTAAEPGDLVIRRFLCRHPDPFRSRLVSRLVGSVRCHAASLWEVIREGTATSGASANSHPPQPGPVHVQTIRSRIARFFAANFSSLMIPSSRRLASFFSISVGSSAETAAGAEMGGGCLLRLWICRVISSPWPWPRCVISETAPALVMTSVSPVKLRFVETAWVVRSDTRPD
jgi:hypothetical protein